MCPGPDQDHDGHASVADGGDDCDDNDRNMYPGIVTASGCSANQIRRCQSSGSYTSCVNLSSAVASDFGAQYNGNLKFCDPTKTTDTGAGTFASPLNCKAFVDSGMSTYYAPSAGDVAYWLGTGNYTQTYSSGGTRMWYLNGRSGTSSHGILIYFASGAAIVGQGASPTLVYPMNINASDYIQAMNVNINGGYSSNGMFLTSDAHFTNYNPVIHDIRGDYTANPSAIRVTNSDFYQEYSKLAYDNYDSTNPTNHNNVNGTVVFDSNQFGIYYGVVYNSSAYGYGDKIKHGYIGGTNNFIKGNYYFNLGWAAVHFESSNTLISRNYWDKVGQSQGLAIENDGCDSSNCEFTGSVVELNTGRNSPGLEFIPDSTYAAIGSPALTFRKNIIINSRSSSFDTAGVDGMNRIDHYGSNALYTDVITGGKLVINYNCYFQQNGVALFNTIFGDIASGSFGNTYSTFAAYQAAGWDVNGFSKDPALDSYSRATDPSCKDFGWMLTSDAATPTPTPSPSPSPSPTPTPLSIVGKAAFRARLR